MLDDLKHTQPVEYKKVPFKYKQCHEYENFTKICRKNLVNDQEPQEIEDQWYQV